MRKILFAALALTAPMAASAQGFGSDGVLAGYLRSIVAFANEIVIPLIIAASILVFIWGMFKYFILGGTEEEQRSKGKQLMIWSVIGLVLMLSIQGIVMILVNTIGGNGVVVDDFPDLPSF